MRTTALLLLVLSLACRPASNPPDPDAGVGGDSKAPATPTAPPHPLMNHAWVRTDSTGLPGVMRIFLEDGTLVMDSCWETYRLSRWRFETDSTVLWTEDGMEIRASVRTGNDQDLVLHLSRPDDEQHYTRATVPYVCPDMKR